MGFDFTMGGQARADFRVAISHRRWPGLNATPQRLGSYAKPERMANRIVCQKVQAVDFFRLEADGAESIR